MKVRHPVCLALAATSPLVHAATVDFESPTFSTATALSPAPATNILTDRPFDGQDSWSRSTSAATGTVFAAPASGLYAAGQAIRGGASTYIGAKAGYALVDPVTKQFTFDLQHGNTSESMVGLWNDDDGDGLFDQTEGQIQFGVMNGGTPRQFGYRAKGFGAQISSGIGGVSGNWYRCLVTIGDPDGITGDRVATMRVLNLTAGTEVDFDTTTFGNQPWTVTIPAASFGAAPADCEGTMVRVTGTAAVDNINGPAPVFPPPSSTWDGGADPDAKWSTAANWVGDVLPVAGGKLFFGSSTLTAPDNDLSAGTVVGGLEFSSGAPSYQLAGNRIALSGTVQNLSTNPQAINLPLEIGGATTFTGTGQIALGAALSGAGGLVKSGTHDLQFYAPSSFSGGTSISAGKISLYAADVLPDAGAFTMTGGTLDVGAFNDKVGDFIANGALTTTVSGAGGGVLSADSFQIQNTAGTVSLNASLGGGGALTKGAAGALTLAGANSYSGGTTINQAIVTASNSGAFGSGAVHLGSAGIASRIQLGNGVDIANDITFHAQAGVSGRGQIEVTGTNSATWSGDLNIEGAGTAGGTTYTDANASLTLTGTINGGYYTQRAGKVIYKGGGASTLVGLTGTATLGIDNGLPSAALTTLGVSGATTLDLAGFSQTFAGLASGPNTATVSNTSTTASVLTLAPSADCLYTRAIQDGAGSVAIIKQGNARQTLSGLNSYTGATTVSAGTLAGSGSSNSAFAVQGGGALAPGAGIGTMLTASANFAAGSALEIEIADWDGNSPGTNWDLLDNAALTLAAPPASPLTIRVKPSSLLNFSEGNRSFDIVSSLAPITGFSAAAVVVDASAMPTTGNWTVQADGTGTRLMLVYTAGAGSTYNAWAFTNAGGQNSDLDYDHDGVPNGVEYFMGASASSFTPNPGIVGGKIIWPKSPTAAASYVVETSSNLKAEVTPGDGGWAPATTGVVDTGTTVEYTVPPGASRFARLKVTTP